MTSIQSPFKVLSPSYEFRQTGGLPRPIFCLFTNPLISWENPLTNRATRAGWASSLIAQQLRCREDPPAATA